MDGVKSRKNWNKNQNKSSQKAKNTLYPKVLWTDVDNFFNKKIYFFIKKYDKKYRYLKIKFTIICNNKEKLKKR